MSKKKQQPPPDPIQKHPFYIDRLVQVWFRYRFPIYAASKEEALEKAKETFNGDDDNLLGSDFQEECLYTTTVFIPPQGPNYKPTKEMFYAWDPDPILDNGIDSINIDDLISKN